MHKSLRSQYPHDGLINAASGLATSPSTQHTSSQHILKNQRWKDPHAGRINAHSGPTTSNNSKKTYLPNDTNKPIAQTQLSGSDTIPTHILPISGVVAALDIHSNTSQIHLSVPSLHH